MMWWQFEGAPSAEEWQAVWAFATFAVAGVAGFVALRQHRETVDTRLEQSRPYVVLDYEFIAGLMITITVTNSGLTAAKNIRFEWSRVPIAYDAEAQQAIDQTLVRDGIPFLAPGRKISFYFSTFDKLPADAPRRFEVIARYSGSGSARLWDSESVLDLEQWSLALVDRDPNEAIVAELKKIAGGAAAAKHADEELARAADSLHRYLEAGWRLQTVRAQQKSEREQRYARWLARSDAKQEASDPES